MFRFAAERRSGVGLKAASQSINQCTVVTFDALYQYYCAVEAVE